MDSNDLLAFAVLALIFAGSVLAVYAATLVYKRRKDIAWEANCLELARKEEAEHQPTFLPEDLDKILDEVADELKVMAAEDEAFFDLAKSAKPIPVEEVVMVTSVQVPVKKKAKHVKKAKEVKKAKHVKKASTKKPPKKK